MLLATGCATMAEGGNHAYPEASSYNPQINGMEEVDAALGRASANGKLVLIALGANWCHDSRALAGWLETPRFRVLLDEKYELVFINIGLPQTGDGHNLDIASRFGFEKVEGTPTVLILSPEGVLLNSDTATSWRNTSTRSEDQIFNDLAMFGVG